MTYPFNGCLKNHAKDKRISPKNTIRYVKWTIVDSGAIDNCSNLGFQGFIMNFELHIWKSNLFTLSHQNSNKQVSIGYRCFSWNRENC